jgi:hypothetical protein
MNLRRSTLSSVCGAALALVMIGCGGSSASNSDTLTPGAGGGSSGNGETGGAGSGGGTAGGGSNPTAGGGDGSTSGTTVAPHSSHKRCAWIGADTFAAGKAAFLANPDFFDAIHPVWYGLTASGAPRQYSMAADAEIMAAAKAHGVKVIPLVDGANADYMRVAFASDASRAAHADALAALAQEHGYDGLEMDYEHLWSAADRAPYSALVAAVAAKLHADGRVLTLAVPALSFDYAENGYDFRELQKSADVLHLMGYDYHWLGGDHVGPIAPKGWIADVVSYVQGLGAPERYSLGIANYGIGGGWYASTNDAIGRCIPGTYSSTTEHMKSCPLGHPDAGLAPHCETAQGTVWFEDAASAGEKAQLAKAHGLGGVAYYTLGDEPTGFFAALAASY